MSWCAFVFTLMSAPKAVLTFTKKKRKKSKPEPLTIVKTAKLETLARLSSGKNKIVHSNYITSNLCSYFVLY